MKEGKKRMRIEEGKKERWKEKHSCRRNEGPELWFIFDPRRPIELLDGSSQGLLLSTWLFLDFQVHFDLDFALGSMQISSPRVPNPDHNTLYSLSEADSTFPRTSWSRQKSVAPEAYNSEHLKQPEPLTSETRVQNPPSTHILKAIVAEKVSSKELQAHYA